ncbi:MAG: lipopolysaccharide biosynthesis protein [Mucilaginibacter sp.]
MSTRHKAVSGILWALWQQISGKLVSFCISIYLARLLEPSQFGLIAMLSVFIAIGNSLMDSGLTSSLIRTSEPDQKDLSTIFYFNLAGSAVIYTALFFAAPLIARFYHQPALTALARVYGLIFISNAFFGIQSTLLIKDMKFRKQTNIQIPSSIVGGIVGILMARLGYGVWSLAGMMLCNSFTSTAFHWILSPWRPSFIFDIGAFKRHFHFGYKITLSGLLDTAYQNLYLIVIGRYFSAAELGLYSRADTISQLPISNISAAINKATYPYFAQFSEDVNQLKVVYKKLMQQVIFWNAPVLILLAIIAGPLFNLLLTAKWAAAVPYFRILCIGGVMYPLHSYNLNVLKVMGESALFLKLEAIKKVLSITGIFICVSYGIYGLLYFNLFFNFLGYYINSFYSGRLIGYPMREQLKDVLPNLLTAAFCGIICYLLSLSLIQVTHNDFMQIGITSIAFVSAYGMLSLVTKSAALQDFTQLILKR